MIPTIDYNVFEEMEVRDNNLSKWKKREVVAKFKDGSCLALSRRGLQSMAVNVTYFRQSRPIEKKILPLVSAFDIPR